MYITPQIAEAITKYCSETLGIIDVYKSRGSVKCLMKSGNDINLNKIIKTKFNFKDLIMEDEVFRPWKNLDIKQDVLETELSRHIIEKFQRVYAGGEEVTLAPEIEEGCKNSANRWMNMIPFIDVEDNFQDFILFDPETETVITEFNRDTWAAKKEMSIREVKAGSRFCKLVFDIKKQECVWLGKDNVTNINLYKTPKYLLSSEEFEPNYDPIFRKVIEHLFMKDKEVLDFVYSWMYFMITDRCQTILALSGDKGIGKGVFSSICRTLVGWRNSALIPQSVLTDKFNTPLRNRRLSIFDEIMLDNQAAKDKMKLYCNNYIPMEGKGVDSIEVENYNSFIISMNTLTGLELEPGDRRYSVPEITTDDLRKVITKKEFDYLTDIFNQSEKGEYPQQVCEFGKWIIENYKDTTYTPVSAWQQRHFMEVIESGMNSWQRAIYDSVLSCEKEYYTFEELKEYIMESEGSEKVYFPQANKVKNFLSGYKHENRTKLGIVDFRDVKKKYAGRDRLKRVLCIIPSDEFLPKNLASNSETTDSPKPENEAPISLDSAFSSITNPSNDVL